MITNELTNVRFSAACFLTVLCGLVFIGLLTFQFIVSDNAEASEALIYVAKIDGSLKYRGDTWPDESSGVNGDIEDALFAAGENGTVNNIW
jgi:hypothetical protein